MAAPGMYVTIVMNSDRTPIEIGALRLLPCRRRA